MFTLNFNLNSTQRLCQYKQNKKHYYRHILKKDNFKKHLLTLQNSSEYSNYSRNKQTQKFNKVSISIAQMKTKMDSVLALILGGGAGTRLYPLTNDRAKPAVPLGGNYRLIDIAISNCINSDIKKIYCLTQFNSSSLNKHVTQTYTHLTSNYNKSELIEILAAHQIPSQKNNWFQGTADAIRKYSWLIQNEIENGIEDIIVLSGDHLYLMDYEQFYLKHKESNADITISCIPVDEEDALSLGIVKTDEEHNIIHFQEKPTINDLPSLKNTNLLCSSITPYIGSMGIYFFKADVLLNLLNEKYKQYTDFGKELIPASIRDDVVVKAYHFNDYWEDIGTIKSFYNANINLTKEFPDFTFYDKRFPIYTRDRGLPFSKLITCNINNSIISHGCYIKKSNIINSVIGHRSIIRTGTIIKDTLIMGADIYEAFENCDPSDGLCTPIGIGENCFISRAIIDKNARIGNNVTIANQQNIQESYNEYDGYVIKDGIVIILKNAQIPDNTII